MTNKKTDLVPVPAVVNRLVPKLQKEVKLMYSALADMESNAWQYAKAVYNIKVNELYKENYKSMSAFGEDFELSRQAVSRYLASVSFMECRDVKELGLNYTNFSYSKASIIAQSKTVQDHSFADFVSFCDMKGYNIITCSTGNLTKAIKEYEKTLNGSDEVLKVEDEPETQEEDNGKTIDATVKDGVVTIIYRKKTYKISVKDLKQYEVKEEEVKEEE